MDKKRPRSPRDKSPNDMDIEEEDEIRFDKTKENEIVNVEFTFSNLEEKSYHTVSNIIKPLFEFQNINLSYLFDVLIAQHEDVGVTIKADDEIFAIFSYIPISFYRDNAKDYKYPFIEQFYTYVLSKLNTEQGENKDLFKDILNKNNIDLALVICERVINMPDQTIPPAMGLITKEINECKECDDYKNQYGFKYMIYISKFAKLLNSKKGSKKKKTENKDNVDNGLLYYKYEAPFMKKVAIASVEYKIPYEQKQMEYLENKNEPQYVIIMLLKAEDYFKVLKDIGSTWEE